MTKREPTKATLATRAFAKIARTSDKINRANDVFRRADERHTCTVKALIAERNEASAQLAKLGFAGMAPSEPETGE